MRGGFRQFYFWKSWISEHPNPHFMRVSVWSFLLKLDSSPYQHPNLSKCYSSQYRPGAKVNGPSHQPYYFYQVKIFHHFYLWYCSYCFGAGLCCCNLSQIWAVLPGNEWWVLLKEPAWVFGCLASCLPWLIVQLAVHPPRWSRCIPQKRLKCFIHMVIHLCLFRRHLISSMILGAPGPCVHAHCAPLN